MARETTYSATARQFHWWTVALLVIQVPLGLYIARQGTATLYDAHKALGLVILALVVARLLYRLVHGAPADEPGIEWWQKAASHATHWSLYLLLILLPIVGWLGVSLYDDGARRLFDGLITIPALASVNRPASDTMFAVHKALAFLVTALVAVHVGAAVVLHYLIRGDGVLARMLPWAARRT